jgi:hypothetical protein
MKKRAIPVANIYRSLENAETDPRVGIRIIQVTGDDTMGLYSAELEPGKRITAHFHTHGIEIYWRRITRDARKMISFRNY